MMEFPFDENDNFEVVNLSTRITQIENKMLQEIGGWLQTGNKTATIRKQEIVRHTIRMAYEYLQMQLENIDKQTADTSSESKKYSQTITSNPTQVIDLKIYHEIANKNTSQISRPSFIK